MPETAWTLLPPLLAIAIAVWRRNALLALACGLLLCGVQLAHWHLLTGAGMAARLLGDVFSSIGNVYIVGFSLLIGAMVTLMQDSGAVAGFIAQLERLKLVNSRRRARLLPTLIGTSIFTDTNLSMFTAGMASQHVFDRYQLSRAHLAYLLDSTCSPVSILILLNGWGAYVLGLLQGYGLNDTTGILLGTISYNFYAILALLLAYYTAVSGRTLGNMATSNLRASDPAMTTQPRHSAPARVMWLPLMLLLATTFVLLWLTGAGDIRQGSGSFSVFWAVLGALLCLLLMLRHYRLMNPSEQVASMGRGIRHMAPAVAILVLSFAFGDGLKMLGTGTYVAALLSVQVPTLLLAPSLFIAAGLMAFATGTSWGTFAIVIPVAIPIALQTGLPVEFLVAAVLSGGVFGDHTSPISDSTVVASIASGCEHYDHVKTQLPHALLAAVLALALFVLVGLRL